VSVPIEGLVEGVEVRPQAANQLLARAGLQGVEPSCLQSLQGAPMMAPGPRKIFARPGIERLRARTGEGAVRARFGQEEGAGRGSHASGGF
jgi:hypothetical protein